MRTDRASRSGGSTWSRTPALTSIRPSIDRFAEGKDLADLPLSSLADLPAVVVRQPWESELTVDEGAFSGLDVGGKAVLVHTGWDRYWRTDRYGENHPFLTLAAAEWLVEQGAALVGIDSNNIDDTRRRARPVHTCLLKAEIPICEHMTGLGQLPDRDFRFSAAPPKVRGMGHSPSAPTRCWTERSRSSASLG